MIKKVVWLVFVALILVFLSGFVYDSLPGEPIELKEKFFDGGSDVLIGYGDVPVFIDKLRFNHNNISFSIDGSCSDDRRDLMFEAFDIFADRVGIISFREVGVDADIMVGCSRDYFELGDNLFAAGEGGPSRIINTSGFKLIEEGKVLLYRDLGRCDYPVVEIHELGHVFGFDHSTDPKNIMYNISGCDQRISQDMVDLIRKLYSIEALPDLVIDDVGAVVKGRYLDFNISILNEGLVGVGAVDLTIVADGDVVEVVDLGEIDVGFGRTLRVKNFKMASRNIDLIEFVVDRNNLVRELDEENNVVQMSSG